MPAPDALRGSAARVDLLSAARRAHRPEAHPLRTAHEDVPAREGQSRPRPRREESRILLPDDESERERGEGRAERKAGELVVRRTPDRSRAPCARRPRRGRRASPRRPRRCRTAHAPRARPRGSSLRPPSRPCGGATPAHDGDTATSGRTIARSSSLAADEERRFDHEVAHQLGVDGECAQRQHRRRRVEQAARGERSGGHGKGAVGGLQTHPAVAEPGSPAREGQGVGGGFGIGEDQALRTSALNYQASRDPSRRVGRMP